MVDKCAFLELVNAIFQTLTLLFEHLGVFRDCALDNGFHQDFLASNGQIRVDHGPGGSRGGGGNSSGRLFFKVFGLGLCCGF